MSVIKACSMVDPPPRSRCNDPILEYYWIRGGLSSSLHLQLHARLKIWAATGGVPSQLLFLGGTNGGEKRAAPRA